MNRIEDPNGNALTFTYSGSQLAKITDAAGRSVNLTYAATGKVIKITDSNTSPARTFQYGYDVNGNQTTFTDPLGNITTYTYDAGHRMAKIIDPLGVTNISYSGPNMTVSGIDRTSDTGLGMAKQVFTYDAAARTTSVTDRINSTTTATTRYVYDADNRLVQTVDPLGAANPAGHVTARTYDDEGNLASVTDQNNHAADFTYDSKGNALTVTDALARSTSFTYDDTFNIITSVRDPLLHTTSYDYDSKGNLIKRTDPLGNMTTYTYDIFGQLLCRTNARVKATCFAYDSRGSLTSITDPLGRTKSFTYDNASRLLTSTDARGQTTTYSYDALDRVVAIDYPGPGNASFSYDANSNLLSAIDPDTHLSFAYDAASRLTSVTDHLLSKTISYVYDRLGNRVQMTDSEGQVIGYSYDHASRLKTINRGGQVFGFLYDNGGRRTRLTLPNGAFTTYSYDPADNLLSLRNAKSNNTVISRFDYHYNADSLRDRVKFLGGVVNYGYDAAHQLTQELRTGTLPYDHRFTYDPVGNRTSKVENGVVTNYAYDDADELTSDGTSAYQYDADGNRTKKTTGSVIETYSYDFRNLLTGYSSPSTTAAYAYDALARRVAKTVGSAATHFLYDGINAIAEYSGAGTLQARNLFGHGIDENLARYVGVGSFHYLDDGLDSVRQLLDASQTVRNSYEYDAWGKLIKEAETATNRYTFTGREADTESSLYYYRARMYDQSHGRFLEVDPVDDGTGRTPYMYCENNPVNLLDPSGRQPIGGDVFQAGLDKAVPYAMAGATGGAFLGGAAGGYAGATAGTFFLGPGGTFLGGFAGAAAGAVRGAVAGGLGGFGGGFLKGAAEEIWKKTKGKYEKWKAGRRKFFASTGDCDGVEVAAEYGAGNGAPV